MLRLVALPAFALVFAFFSSVARGQTQFAELAKLHVSDSTEAVVLGDVDGDGDLDMVFGNSGNGEQNRLYLNDGNGAFTDATIRLPKDRDETYAVALGDVDGDRDLDLVCGNNWGPNRLYLNDGKGTFTDATASRLPASSGWYTNAVALGDVDGDGDLDLVCGNQYYTMGPVGRPNRLYLNDGKGTFTDATASRFPTVLDITLAVALGDVDGDRDLDLVFGNENGQNRLYLNDGKGTFTDATATRLPPDGDVTETVALGDVDGDGDLDMVCGNWRQNRLYLNDGSGKFIDATASRLPKNTDLTLAVALGDVDEDGDFDLVCGNSSDPMRLYLNDGKGTFTEGTAARLPKDSDVTHAVALGDVDGDGDLDLVFGNQRLGAREPSRLYTNLHRQIHAPLLAVGGSDYQLDFYAEPGYASTTQFAVPFLNLAPAVPAIQRPPFGTIGVNPVGMSMLPQVNVPTPAGKASIKFKIPASPVLVGLTGYIQALMVHGVTPLEAHFTNVVADRIIK